MSMNGLKKKFLRLLKVFDEFVLDLLFPDVGQDDDPPWHR